MAINFSSLDKNDFLTFVPVTQELQTPWHLKIGRITKHPVLATQNTKPVEPGRFKWTSEALLPWAYRMRWGYGTTRRRVVGQCPVPDTKTKLEFSMVRDPFILVQQKTFLGYSAFKPNSWAGTGYLQIILNSWDFQREATCVILICCCKKMKCKILMRGISRSTSPSHD